MHGGATIASRVPERDRSRREYRYIRADGHAVVKVDDVVVDQADKAGGHVTADVYG
jgi:hypothetical protein